MCLRLLAMDVNDVNGVGASQLFHLVVMMSVEAFKVDLLDTKSRHILRRQTPHHILGEFQ